MSKLKEPEDREVDSVEFQSSSGGLGICPWESGFGSCLIEEWTVCVRSRCEMSPGALGRDTVLGFCSVPFMALIPLPGGGGWGAVGVRLI